MALPLWMSNLIAYSLQIAILAATGTLLAFLFRLRVPRWALAYWQALLIVCICTPVLQPWRHPAFGPPIVGSAGVVSRVPVVAVPASQPPATQIPWEVLGLILAAGIVLKLMWLSLGFVRLRLFRSRSHLYLEEHISVRDIQERTGVRVPLLLSNEIDSPVTFGFRSPAIILPHSWKDLSEPCRKAVVCHELLHVRRCDWILIIAEEIVGAIFWFHPAVWWLLNRIHLSREQTVDYEVVRLTGNKQPYLDSLLEFARAHGRPRAVPAPLFLKESNLVQRVALLLKEVSMSRSRLAVSMICMGILVAGTVYISAGWFPLTSSPLAAQERTAGEEMPAPVLTVGENIQQLKLIYRVAPVYPEEAKAMRLNGVVRLRVSIDEAGSVSTVTAISGHPLLIDAAIGAVKQWRYSPTLLNGSPVPVLATVSCYFNFGDSAPSLREGDGGPAPRRAVVPPNIGPLTSVKVVADGRAAVASSPAPPVQEQAPDAQIKPPRRAPIRVGSMIQESKLIHRVEPIYPEQALREHIQGTVKLMIVINEEGFVYELSAMEGNDPILEAAAIDAVKQWQYSPTLLNGEPVAAQATVTVVFQLK